MLESIESTKAACGVSEIEHERAWLNWAKAQACAKKFCAIMIYCVLEVPEATFGAKLTC
jgi:hypothetical protein